MLRRIGLFLIVAVLGINCAYADVPRVVNYQGRLTDLNGNALLDGSYSIAIRLYDSDTAPESSAIWSDNYSVQTKNGYFNVMLGSNASFPLNLPFDRQYYLGIKVGIDTEMTPRQPLNSVPYALNAGHQFIGFKILTASSGTYTPSYGTRAILVEAQGGGGGGGGATSGAGTIGVGAGGRGGGYCAKYISPVAASYQYSVGQAGSGGGAGASGTNGGDTTFGLPVILTAEGGNSGGGGPASTPPVFWGSGGTSVGATGGDVNVPGQTGNYAFSLSASQGTGGTGAPSRFGRGGAPGYNGNNGGDAAGYGAGGGGACAINSIDRSGGNGTPGVIVIWEFK